MFYYKISYQMTTRYLLFIAMKKKLVNKIHIANKYTTITLETIYFLFLNFFPKV